MSALDDYIDRAGAGAVLMVSPAAYDDIRKNTQPLDWHISTKSQFYRGALVEYHGEWSWGWMVRKADGTYVEARAIKAQRAETPQSDSVADESAVAESDLPNNQRDR